MESANPSLELVTGRPVYRYFVAWTISGDLALELDMTGVTWSRQIRLAGTFSGTAGFNNDRELGDAFWGTMPGKMSLFVTRDGKPVWGGIIARRAYDASTRQLQIDAVGFESYLYRRKIWCNLSYPNTVDQYAVARSLIAQMQTDFAGVATAADRGSPHPESGNIGLTVDGSVSGRTQDAQSWRGDELTTFGEALEGFSNNLNGFEYNIEIGVNATGDKFTKRLVFRQAPPSQLPVNAVYEGPRPGLEENFFEFPGNALTVGYEDTVDEAATRFWVTGMQPESDAPEGAEPPVPRGAWENEAYLATNWPLLEEVEASEHSSVSRQETLDAYASSYGKRVAPPIPTWSIVVNGGMNPQAGSYAPGDWCRFVVSDPFLRRSIESEGTQAKVLTKRIAAISVSVPDTTQLPETVTLTLIDEWDDDGGT